MKRWFLRLLCRMGVHAWEVLYRRDSTTFFPLLHEECARCGDVECGLLHCPVCLAKEWKDSG